MTWPQNYDPFGNWVLSTLVAAVPVLTLFFVLKARVWVAAFSGMVAAIVLANLVFGMLATLVAAAAGHGGIFGMLRIGWIIIASIFLYNIAVETGQFQIMKDSIAGLSGDKRLQLILIAFCFGAFLEGTGGGGAPVAITGAFLIGLGFNPFQAAVLCLVANTAPVAWGGVGNPIRTLAGVTGRAELHLRQVALTGTDAGSNALFANLQKVTAEQLSLSPILMGAANSAGGVMGTMIDAQSIVVASASTQQVGNEAAIFKAVFWQSVVLASLVGLIVMSYAYLFPWLIPG
jgi:L-lactate permease